jgi:hypothetical protein
MLEARLREPLIFLVSASSSVKIAPRIRHMSGWFYFESLATSIFH